MRAARSKIAARAPAHPGASGPRRAVRLLVLDVDGVLTDGRLLYGARGEELKSFSVRDGHGLKALRSAGIEVAVISGRRSAAVRRRCRELGIRHLIEGAEDKLAAFVRLASRLKVRPAQCACIGDDVPDIPLMRAVGLSYAVADAHPAAKRAARRATALSGGSGAVREVCDLLLAAGGRKR
ncbi:MAG TPA: HAD-IIIA family hydrolase [Steroidobacteraceae bacterium]|nr:HAD-IIIA family hydrolase [Steroidobacteraceae bacterium]